MKGAESGQLSGHGWNPARRPTRCVPTTRCAGAGHGWAHGAAGRDHRRNRPRGARHGGGGRGLPLTPQLRSARGRAQRLRRCCCMPWPACSPAAHPLQPPAPAPPPAGKFPKSVCTSVNECICHGIPDSRPLREGDIVNIDVTVFLNVRAAMGAAARGWRCNALLRFGCTCLAAPTFPSSRCCRAHCACPLPLPLHPLALQGYHGDTSRMFYVGQVAPAARQLCEATKEALDAGGWAGVLRGCVGAWAGTVQ